MHETLKKLCEKHKDVRLVKQDSYEAGNCEEGTRNFIEEYFPNRRVLRVSELIPFIEQSRAVRSVIIYKLRPLEKSEHMETAIHES